ncbi:MAG: poly-gamma-glutamate system protein [Myxococcales bacterium]|nr:poly-gamma-glutamate system protein [Myxococcales bacterium]
MKRVYWRPQRISRSAMLLIAMLAAATLVAVEKFPVSRRQRNYSEKLAASRLALEAFNAIKSEKINRGIGMDPEADPFQTGLIGRSVTPVTSNTGYLSAKRMSVNPNFAALVVHWLIRAGVEKNDVVAVGGSGSFPALCIAAFAAVQTLELTPIVISSASASEWGANDPNFMWLDMEKALYDRRVFSFRSLAASRGGIEDYGFGMSQEGRNLLDEAIKRAEIDKIDAKNLADGIDQRMQLFDAKAGGKPIKAYVNVGGGTASVGTHVGKKQFKPGLNMEPPGGAQLADSVMLRFAERGVPVVHLTSLEALAKQYGFPTEARGLPRVGEGKVFVREEYNRWIAGVGLVAILAAMLAFIRLDVGARILQGAIRRKDRARQPQQMV